MHHKLPLQWTGWNTLVGKWAKRGGGFVDCQHLEYISQAVESDNDGDVQQGPRFQKSFDYYSLGIVLLEIGSWEPIESFTKRHPTRSPAQLRKILIEKYAPVLDLYIGRLYKDATLTCLGDDLVEDEEGEPEWKPVAHRSNFFTRVVEPLSKISVG
ncbi:hypothetical protein G7Y89_g11242 [Cudoniella acicularis]|uniref:Protein kinase domain-containing protein n=1 Tax=Cudoniella acicularis TaxID=354080 RepID=A0A8H4RB78_9HELO|nr:hypothetical protein G7Y89_g11242 [Cudoniella acicularis]